MPSPQHFTAPHHVPGTPPGANGTLPRETGAGGSTVGLGSAEAVQRASMAGVPHEFRTPLGALVTALEVIALTETDPVARSHASTVALRQCRQLAQLVDGLEDVLAAREDRLTLRRAELDFSELVATAWDAIGATVPPHLWVQALTPGLRVQADPRLMRMCVESVFRKGLASLRTGERLELLLEAKEGGALLSSRTLPAAHSSKMPTEAMDHTPLTSLLAHEVAELHGGYLSLSDTEEAGAHLWLPLAPANAIKATRSPRQRSLLLCLHNRHSRGEALRQVRLGGEWTVVGTAAHSEALATLLETVPDLALMSAAPADTATLLARQAREAGYAGTMIAIALSVPGGTPLPAEESWLDEPSALRAGYDALVVADAWGPATLAALRRFRRVAGDDHLHPPSDHQK